MKRRAWLVGGLATAVVAAGSGIAIATAAFTPSVVSTPRSYFEVCREFQQDIAGINPADLVTKNVTITSRIYAQPPNSSSTFAFDNFVSSKSGIDGTNRRILVSQYVSYRDAGRTQPVQIRCKWRTGESLNRSDFQKLDNGTTTTVPWGFGSGTAAGSEGTCQAVNQQLAKAAWDSLTTAQKNAAPVRWEASDAGSANAVADSDIETFAGPNWTSNVNPAYLGGDGNVHVTGKSLYILSTDTAGLGDRFKGGHYCTLAAPEFLRDIFLGNVSSASLPTAAT